MPHLLTQPFSPASTSCDGLITMMTHNGFIQQIQYESLLHARQGVGLRGARDEGCRASALKGIHSCLYSLIQQRASTIIKVLREKQKDKRHESKLPENQSLKRANWTPVQISHFTDGKTEPGEVTIRQSPPPNFFFCMCCHPCPLRWSSVAPGHLAPLASGGLYHSDTPGLPAGG